MALLAEVEAEGGKVSLVARRHGISESLIYNWGSAWRAAASMRPMEPFEFMPIGMIGCATEASPMPLVSSEPAVPIGRRRDDGGGGIEIDLPNGVRVHVDAFVNEKALARVFRALKGTT